MDGAPPPGAPYGAGSSPGPGNRESRRFLVLAAIVIVIVSFLALAYKPNLGGPDTPAGGAAQRLVTDMYGREVRVPAEIKRLVADKTVRMRTDVSLDDLRTHACVQRAERSNDHTVVYTDAPERLLEDLFRDGHAVRDLSVVDTELEAAFVSLTRTWA